MTFPIEVQQPGPEREAILNQTTGPQRAYYAASVEDFLGEDSARILGLMTAASAFSVDQSQRDAWLHEMTVLRIALAPHISGGHLYFELVVPRVGKRIDAVVVIGHTVFVVEFKVGARAFSSADVEQVWDYALDLKNFHETSHSVRLAPVLVITGITGYLELGAADDTDKVLRPALVSADRLGEFFESEIARGGGEPILAEQWQQGRYKPTPTIIEAATALYGRHSVQDISRRDAGAKNLARTSAYISTVIQSAKAKGVKVICFVTGVPGAGKTLVGLDVATRHMDAASDMHSVYLSGNGPLVEILREALVRDDVARAKAKGHKKTKAAARQAVKSFIQPIHHFRDECLVDLKPPVDHVAIFDESQRAWSLEKTADFMQRKKGRPGFQMSEPAFLISCLDRHRDWAVVVCLVGGGQEIHTGEAGISEWLSVVHTAYPEWHVHVSPVLTDSEYGATKALEQLAARATTTFNEDLHLSVSMRSFRAENVSSFVKKVLDLETEDAAALYQEFRSRYPIVLTRCVDDARAWLRGRARGSQRYGIVVSSQAMRLKPHAIDVKSPVEPVNWFLNDRNDVRSSYYLEDVATEFHVQGLELDWACVVWDADFRFSRGGWEHHSFVGSKWNRVLQDSRRTYLKNAYRVLLTRARQGMVIVVPEGQTDDPTRASYFYDGTFEYLRSVGLPVL